MSDLLLEIEEEGNGRPGAQNGRSTLLARVQGGAVSPDHFQTPDWACDVIAPYLPRGVVLWESARGQGNLVRGFTQRGWEVVGTDLLTGRDFFIWEPARWDVQVTNVPFSLKDRWLARSYALGKPFAIIMPITALAEQGRMAMYREHGIQVVLPDRRINFETPSGQGTGAWLFTAWFCWGLNLERDLMFWTPSAGSREAQRELFGQ